MGEIGVATSMLCELIRPSWRALCADADAVVPNNPCGRDAGTASPPAKPLRGGNGAPPGAAETQVSA